MRSANLMMSKLEILSFDRQNKINHHFFCQIMPKKTDLHCIQSITQLLAEMGLDAPSHPLIALVDYSDASFDMLTKGQKISLEFYKISFRPNFKGYVKYGQGHYDFDEGGLAFVKPKQIVFTPEELNAYVGLAMYVHPDFIRNYPLGKLITQYGFFSYDVSEALFLSAREKETIAGLFNSILTELSTNIDKFSQDILVSQIELLLNFSNRYYHRQFLTREVVNNHTISILDQMLTNYFEGHGIKSGLPTVQDICDALGLSQRYLSDMLKSFTGLNTQQYIQNALIETAKQKLSTTELSVSEIAYELGFEHPQSFSKMFKSKTSQSPLQFRQAFN